MKTYKKHFQLFKENVVAWTEYFGLKTWDIVCEHEKLPITDDADFDGNISDRWARIRLSTIVSDPDVKKLAFHEVCELLLHEYDTIVCDSNTSPEIRNTARHNVIRILENTIFRDRGKLLSQKESNG